MFEPIAGLRSDGRPHLCLDRQCGRHVQFSRTYLCRKGVRYRRKEQPPTHLLVGVCRGIAATDTAGGEEIVSGIRICDPRPPPALHDPCLLVRYIVRVNQAITCDGNDRGPIGDTGRGDDTMIRQDPHPRCKTHANRSRAGHGEFSARAFRRDSAKWTRISPRRTRPGKGDPRITTVSSGRAGSHDGPNSRWKARTVRPAQADRTAAGPHSKGDKWRPPGKSCTTTAVTARIDPKWTRRPTVFLVPRTNVRARGPRPRRVSARRP